MANSQVPHEQGVRVDKAGIVRERLGTQRSDPTRSNQRPVQHRTPRVLPPSSRGAEGFESRTRPRFIDFLGRAKASAGEVRCQLVIARDQEYVREEEFDDVSDLADKTSRQLYHLIRHLEQNNESGQVQEIPEEYRTN